MFTLPFVILVTGLLVTGYSLAFSGSSVARTSAVTAIGFAGLIVGALVTAHLNGGKPYGLNVPFGIEQWKRELMPSPAPVPPKPRDAAPAIA